MTKICSNVYKRKNKNIYLILIDPSLEEIIKQKTGKDLHELESEEEKIKIIKEFKEKMENNLNLQPCWYKKLKEILNSQFR